MMVTVYGVVAETFKEIIPSHSAMCKVCGIFMDDNMDMMHLHLIDTHPSLLNKVGQRG